MLLSGGVRLVRWASAVNLRTGENDDTFLLSSFPTCSGLYGVCLGNCLIPYGQAMRKKESVVFASSL